MEEDKEVPMHKHILCKTRTGTVKEFDVDRCYEQFGFYVGDRVHTPKGPAFVVGVQNGQLYFMIDGDKGASKWKDCFRSDFPQRGFSLIYSPSVAMKMSRKYRAPELKSLVNSEEFSDVSFFLDDGRRVFANRGILAKRSEYFRALFNPGHSHMRMQDSNSKEVAIHGVGYDIFVAILEYLYCGEVRITEATAIDLVKAADLFMLDTLKSTVADFLIEHTTTESVLSLLQLADQRGLPALKEHCKSFLINILRHQPSSEIRHRFLEFISPLNRDLILELTLQPCLTGTGAACAACAQLATSQASQQAAAAAAAASTLGVPPLLPSATPGAGPAPIPAPVPAPPALAAPALPLAITTNTAPGPRPDPVLLPNRLTTAILPLSPTTSTLRERQIGEPAPPAAPPVIPTPTTAARRARIVPTRSAEPPRHTPAPAPTSGPVPALGPAPAPAPTSAATRVVARRSTGGRAPRRPFGPNRYSTPTTRLPVASNTHAASSSSSSAPTAASTLGTRMASAALDGPNESQNSQPLDGLDGFDGLDGDGIDADGAQPGAPDPAPRADAETDADGDADMADSLSAAAANGHESDIQSPNTPSPPAAASVPPAGPSAFDVEAPTDASAPPVSGSGSGSKRRRVGAPPSPSS